MFPYDVTLGKFEVQFQIALKCSLSQMFEIRYPQ